ncbi:MAG: class I SAM-dependent methyltransferase [Burkholderiales bacterium]|nr:class I SAM-dependent methyltransferase [Burkholderiales bacterium]
MLLENRLRRMLARVSERDSIPLRLVLWNGRQYDFAQQPSVTVRIPSPSALRFFVNPDLNRLGEAYVEGRIQVEGPVQDLFGIAERFTRHAARERRGVLRFGRHSRAGDRAAIEQHYDVSDDFYRLFLDRNMVYSCAYYRSDSDTLEQAQLQKLDHILAKLRMRPGDRFLDIGCGWGSLILRAVKRCGANAVGITLSRNQYQFVKRRIAEEGLEGRCEVRLQDYRDIPAAERYRRIASVGMFEHVGLRNLGAYFRKMRSLLTEDGLVLNHGITASGTDSRWVGRGAGEFIHRYVFPGGELPHVSLAIREMSAAGLEVLDIESLRRHYARTCREWAARLAANYDAAVSAAGEKRARVWNVYLAGCAFGFAHGWMNIYQVLACGEGAADGVLPLTRDDIYGAPDSPPAQTAARARSAPGAPALAAQGESARNSSR